MAKAFVFVDSSRNDDAARRRARSHVMQGKNLGKKINRRTRLAVTTVPCGGRTSQGETCIPRSRCDLMRLCAKPKQGLGHALSSLALPVEITAESARAINHFFNSTAERMYPVHLGITIEASKLMWLKVLFVDEPSFHCNVALMQTCNEVYDSNDSSSPRALNHIARSLPYVQRILNSDDALSDSSIAIVVSFICQEMIRNCLEETNIHFQGLTRMVDLRGGLLKLEHHLALALKICKVDIVCSLQSGRGTTFFRDTFPKLDSSTSASHARPAGVHALDHRLHSVFHDAMVLCHRIQNTSSQALDLLTFEEVVVSFCYRLLSFRTLHETSQIMDINSHVHLGLLLFSMTLFLQHRARQIIYFPILSRSLYEVLRAKSETEEPGIMLWLSMFGGMWVEGDTERFMLTSVLSSTAMKIGLTTWREAKELLFNFPWLSEIHDGPGRALWDETIRSYVFEDSELDKELSQ